METVMKLEKLEAKLAEIESTVDADLKPYFTNYRKDIKKRLELIAKNKQAKKLVAAWNKTITPVTGVKALDASYIDDLGFFNLDIESDDPDRRYRSLRMGETIKEGLGIITNKSPNLLKYQA